jgi:pimeloyl-ACP methyl ester carboxylesterase
VAFDARGHGDSDWCPDGNYSQNAMVSDLNCVLTAFGGRQPVLVGASMGGCTSLVAVGENSVDARALILVDIVPHTEPAGVARIQTFMQQMPEGFASLDEVADAITRYRLQQTRPRSLDGLAKNVRLGKDGKFRWHWDPRFIGHQPVGVRTSLDTTYAARARRQFRCGQRSGCRRVSRTVSAGRVCERQ